jgi:hypothetical protein
VLQALAGFSVGFVFYVFGLRAFAAVAGALAALVLFAVLVSPTGLYAGLQRLFEATGRVVGRGMTWLVMVPLFYLFFLPFGLLMRRGRRDRLRRFCDGGASTYWEPHSEVQARSRERQY